MRVLLYRGKSLISLGIKFQTRSPYSHVAVELDDGSVIEAWHKGGVRRLATGFDGHDEKTVIDVFDITEDFLSEEVERFLWKQLGMKYDFRSIVRFLTRVKAKENGRWFCSELCIAAFRAGHLSLLRGNAGQLSPRDVSLSPYLKYIGQYTLNDDKRVIFTEKSDGK